MIINVSYDASAANAPAGFKQAVQAAVQYFETTITNNITINIDFGWGEVAGQAMDAGSLGESSASLVTTSATSIIGTMLTWGSHDPGAIAGYLATEGATAAEAGVLQGNSATIGSNGVSGGVMVITLAQARALGHFAQGGNPVDAIDGYVGLGSGANYSFDPNNRAVAGAYDAIGVLEHEISEVLGRSAGLGQPLSDGTHAYTPLDLYRYTAPGQPSLTPGAGYMSFDGGRTVSSPFNDPANGGDAGDWSTAVSGDAFDAFAQPGVALTLSSVDLREMEALGYSLSVPVDVIGSSDIITGVSPDGSVTNSGGVETVLATAAAADAIGMYSYNSNFNNAATIQVTSAMADAWGDFYTTNFTNQAGPTLTVTAAHQAMGDLSGGGSFSNAGTMTVTGQTAYGEVGATSFTNSGTMTIIATGAGAKSIAVDISNPWGLSYTNSGTINADYAFWSMNTPMSSPYRAGNLSALCTR